MNTAMLLETRNLHWSYGQQKVLDSINITVKKSCFCGLIGPNGSGKTTLIKNISRILVSQKNSVYIYGKDICQYSSREFSKLVAYVPQNTNVEFEFTAMDVVLMGRSPYLKRFEPESMHDMDIAREAMFLTNTWHLKDKSISKLSGGEKQRVVIARALCQNTEIIILDEPVSHLDLQHQIELMRLLKQLCNEGKKTVIMSIHDLNLASQFCDDIILMNRGKVFDFGNPENIFDAGKIKEVYGIDVMIDKNPVTGKPHVIPFIKMN